MKFNEKLNFLMNITNTKNSTLALNTALDASHISRLRRGLRALPKNQNFVRAMALYFSKHCSEDYQKKVLSEFLNNESVTSKKAKDLSELLNSWLLEENSDNKTVGDFLEKLSNFKFAKPLTYDSNVQTLNLQTKDVGLYMGTQGKREAVLDFLTSVITNNKTQTLLLYSDEDMTWQFDDNDYKIKWAILMSQTIMKGNRIKIIHNVSRNLDEMLAAITGWMPLYMTGAIEPYYYPKKRDGVFKRTIFIAPENCVITSTSNGEMVSNAVNFLIKDKKAISSFIEEFNQYLALCRPLMKIFTVKDKDQYFNTLIDFEQESANTIIKTGSLSILSMPKTVVKEMLNKINNEKKYQIAKMFENRILTFEKLLINNTFTEIISIPNINTIKEGKLHVIFSDMLNDVEIFYTPDEYRLQLENIVRLLKKFENYRVYISSTEKDVGYSVYVKEDIGTIVAKTSTPSVILAIRESNLNAAFWDHLNSKIEPLIYDNQKRKNTIKKLEQIIEQLK
jgi:hypothetical protein